jgi:hypothetical protein
VRATVLVWIGLCAACWIVMWLAYEITKTLLILSGAAK